MGQGRGRDEGITHGVQRRCIRSIVVADPAPKSSDRLVAEFSAMGIDVWLAQDLETLENVIDSQHPDVVLLELTLRDGTWREALERVGKRGQSRVVVLTSRGSIGTAIAALWAGAENYILKPVTATQLMQLLNDETERSRLPHQENGRGWSLSQATSEILLDAMESCGSVSAAAKTLRIDRRSLQRRLSKLPPRFCSGRPVDDPDERRLSARPPRRGRIGSENK